MNDPRDFEKVFEEANQNEAGARAFVGCVGVGCLAILLVTAAVLGSILYKKLK